MISSVTNLAAVHEGFVQKMSEARHQTPIEYNYSSIGDFREWLDDLETRLLESATDSATIVIKLESGQPIFSATIGEEMIDLFSLAGQSRLNIHLFV